MAVVETSSVHAQVASIHHSCFVTYSVTTGDACPGDLLTQYLEKKAVFIHVVCVGACKLHNCLGQLPD
jgi:hypothetical protein